MTQTTHIFTLSPGVYSSVLLKKLTGRYWWLLLPLVAFVIAGRFLDTAWYFLIPIFLFLIYPSLLFWVYIVLSVSPFAADSLKPHSFTIDGHEIRYTEYEPLRATVEESPRKRITVFDDAETAGFRAKRTYAIPLSDIGLVDHADNMDIYHLRRHPGKFIIIPNNCKTNPQNDID